MLWSAITLASGLVLVLLVLRAVQVLRQERDAPRGTLPGPGHTIVESHYISGGAGGGSSQITRVPKDPQAYAKAFVPKERT